MNASRKIPYTRLHSWAAAVAWAALIGLCIAETLTGRGMLQPLARCLLVAAAITLGLCALVTSVVREVCAEMRAQTAVLERIRSDQLGLVVLGEEISQVRLARPPKVNGRRPHPTAQTAMSRLQVVDGTDN
jgi:hypothetical protein